MESLIRLRDHIPAIADVVHDNSSAIEGVLRHATATLSDAFHDASSAVRPSPKRPRRMKLAFLAIALAAAVATVLIAKKRSARTADEFAANRAPSDFSRGESY